MASDEDEFLFEGEEEVSGTDQTDQGEPWRVLVVDDDQQVISATKLSLADFSFDDRPLEFLCATSGAEARDVLKQEQDIALILLDVTMESEHEGLKVARWVREELGNKEIRIILRTGQPGQAPEREVVIRYDINDYKEKTDLNYRKMHTMMVSVLRSYRDLVALRKHQENLENLVAEKTRSLKEENDLRREKEQKLLIAEQELMVKNAKLETSLNQQRDTNESLARFVSVTSRHLQTPVTVIEGLMDRLTRNAGQASTEYVLQKYDQIRDALDHLQEDLNRLLAGAAMEGGMVQCRLVTSDLSKHLTEVIDQFRKMDPDLKLLVDIEDLPKEMAVDTEAIKHVLSHLITNAVRFSKPGREIKISGGVEGEDVVISVQDAGQGISDNDLPKIFDQFYRGANSKGVNGTGLGLYIVRKLVDQHEGDITVESEAGKGSCFYVRLPKDRP